MRGEGGPGRLGPSLSPSLLLLQITDSACPTGGFAHSGGLEGLKAQGSLNSAADLRDVLERLCRQGLLGKELAPLREGYAAVAAGDGAAFAVACRRCVATRLTAATRQADDQRGRALLRLWQTLSGLAAPPAEPAPCAYSVAFGGFGAASGNGLAATATGYAFQHLAGLAAAAVRLGVCGAAESQRVLAAAWPCAAEAVEQLLAGRETRPGWFTPELDLAQLQHEELDARLFLT